MSKWVLLGIRSGTKTTRYPSHTESAAGISPGRPKDTLMADKNAQALIRDLCPTGALNPKNDRIAVDYRRCISCRRCARGASTLVDWEESWEWASLSAPDLNASSALGSPFSQSLHIRVLDAGACRACLSEIEQLGKPYYNIHRLGFFMTPTPRHADVLLVAGPVADNMRLPLEKAYDAMPTPKRVVAVGACALSGGVFGPSFTSYGSLKNVIPVDVEIPGCPPPPLAIIHGLLVLTGRRPPAESGATSFLDRRSGT
uniref:NADH:ubiquinone oxidoreductase-like 20kDa subunit domain-containing protein n=1 Tax=Desulfomonile tiedjei TaxID=2358 RepID=A0A7C4ET79_9BACT